MTIVHDRSLSHRSHPPHRRTRALAHRLPDLIHGLAGLALGSLLPVRHADTTECDAVAPPTGDTACRWFDLAAHRPTDRVAVLRVAGALRSHTAPLLEAAVEEHVRPPTQIIVVDLRDVTFFGGSGLRCLMRIRAVADHAGAWLRVVCHRRPVGRSLTLLGLADTLHLYPDLELALAAPDAWPPDVGPARLSGLDRTRPPGTEPAEPTSNRVHIAVLQYLEAVTDALKRRSIAVGGVETITASEGVFGGRLGLGRRRLCGSRTGEVVELRWDEITGWEVALRPHRDLPRTPYRFLGDELAPSPHLVSAFTHALLRGADVGVPEAAQFRSPDDELHALVGRLEAATAQPEPGYLQQTGYPPR